MSCNFAFLYPLPQCTVVFALITEIKKKQINICPIKGVKNPINFSKQRSGEWFKI